MRTEVKIGIIAAVILAVVAIYFLTRKPGTTGDFPMNAAVVEEGPATPVGPRTGPATPGPSTPTRTPVAPDRVTPTLPSRDTPTATTPPPVRPPVDRATPPLTDGPGPRITPATQPARTDLPPLVSPPPPRPTGDEHATTQPSRDTTTPSADAPVADPGPRPGVTPPPAGEPVRPGVTPTPPPVRPTTPTAGTPAATTYEVQRGDSLWSIAQEHLGDGNLWPRIQAANPGLNPQTLKVGQRINLPPKEATATPEPAPTPAPRPADRPSERTTPPPAERIYTYIVEENDTLYGLAARFLGDGNRWREIYELNRATIANPNILPAGIEIRIPPRSP